MRIGRFLGFIIAAGCVFTGYATDSRVLTMGRNDNFFMDEVSIFKNPANINVYPNMLLGDLGRYNIDPNVDDTSEYAGLERFNRDPQHPFFGGILSYSLNRSAEAGDQYPMLSIGAVLNRKDEMIDLIDPNSSKYAGTSQKELAIDSSFVKMYEPIGKVDIIAGFALKNGGMIGVGGYLAWQKVVNDQDKPTYESSLYKANVGINMPLTKTMDLEASFGGAQLNGVGKVVYVNSDGDTAETGTEEVVASGDETYRADVRLFSAMTVLNGDFVPHAGFQIMNLEAGKARRTDINGGLGLNINIDRGFFWAGIEGIYENYDEEISTEEKQRIGGRISFGIERNVIWDWLVWRAGGCKKIWYEDGVYQDMWGQNAEADASDEDVLAFGVGLNIENRLKVDGIVAEDIFYTFSNLFSGNAHHLMTRISATYSF